jgi:hypothetical protein
MFNNKIKVMKKISVLLLIACCLYTLEVKSQKGFYVGAGFSGLSTWMTNQNNYGLSEMDYKMTFGFAGNANIGYNFSKHIGLKLEIGYAKLGQDYKDNINDTAYARKVQLYYLEIPLLFKYMTSGEVARFYFLAGPQIGFLMNAKQTYLKAGDPDDKTVKDLKNNVHKISEESITDRFTSTDISARIDVGVDITLIPNLVLNAGLTFNYGLTDINASDWRIPDSSGNYNASHNIFGGMNVGICYVFASKK